MKRVFNTNSFIICALSGMALATFAQFFFIYYSLLAYCTAAFGIICIVDLCQQTSYRRYTGTVLAKMFFIAIVALITLYGISQYYN